MIELPAHPYFVGVPVPPRVQVRPQAPHPLFRRFIAAALRARLGERRTPRTEIPAAVDGHASARQGPEPLREA